LSFTEKFGVTLHGIMLVGRGVIIVMSGSVSVYRCMSLCSVCVHFKRLYVVDETAVVTAGRVFTVWYSITAY